MKAVKAATILGGALLMAACNLVAGAREGDEAKAGPSVRKDFQVASFDRVSLAGSHNVVVTVGSAPSVRAEGDAETLELLEVKVENGVLHVGTRNGKGKWFSDKGHRSATIYVTAPAIAAASIGGSGDMKIDKVEGERFAASIGGSGDMEIGSIKVGDAAFSIAGSGNIRGSGTAQSASISVAGSGDIGLQDLEARRATISVVGSGDIRAKAMESADVSVMGSGDVELAGPAKCNINKMGSGDVRCTG